MGVVQPLCMNRVNLVTPVSTSVVLALGMVVINFLLVCKGL